MTPSGGDALGPDPAAADELAGRSFEELVDELEAVTEQLATGAIGIEAAADLYERAQRLHAAAQARLAAVQARIDRLGEP
ncbi:MAG TPA: exodeoxyribonuclease VII small subunit [Acidimicrobiales bacterium]|nr:exodeoxyribonuclease VII small subunit [Acidimicrobiales bacterium]